MKVILLENVETIGKKYDIKEVKNGYARNFLIPKKLAKTATRLNLKWLNAQKEIIEKEATEDLQKVQAIASELDGLEVSIALKVGEKGELFESISAAKVAEKLKEMGFVVKKSQINLEKPLKETGEFGVKIALDHNLEPEIKLIITQEHLNRE